MAVCTLQELTLIPCVFISMQGFAIFFYSKRAKFHHSSISNRRATRPCPSKTASVNDKIAIMRVTKRLYYCILILTSLIIKQSKKQQLGSVCESGSILPTNKRIERKIDSIQTLLTRARLLDLLAKTFTCLS